MIKHYVAFSVFNPLIFILILKRCFPTRYLSLLEAISVMKVQFSLELS